MRPIAACALLALSACQYAPGEGQAEQRGGPLGGVLNNIAAPAAAETGASPAPDAAAQRRAILDALRPAIETSLRSPVEFVVQRIGVQDGWALVIADPQRPGGGAIDARHLPAQEERDGLTVHAILRLQNDRWTLVDHVIGPTDVWECGIAGPPAALTGC